MNFKEYKSRHLKFFVLALIFLGIFAGTLILSAQTSSQPQPPAAPKGTALSIAAPRNPFAIFPTPTAPSAPGGVVSNADRLNCVNAGGTMVNNNVCQFAASGCPSGWTLTPSATTYWSATQAQSCDGTNANCSGGTSCTTGSHGWSIASGPETCDYTMAVYSKGGKASNKEGPFLSSLLGAATNCSLVSDTCTAQVVQIGCVKQ